MSQDLSPSRTGGGQPARTDVEAALLGGRTFRTLSEQTLSPREERFERTRQTIGFFLAPAVTIIFALWPSDMDSTQQLLAAILLGVIVLWICEPVPIPIGGLIGVAAVVILGVAPSTAVLAPFGSTTIFTFIGAFILAQAMLKHGLAQRLAFAVLSLPRRRAFHLPRDHRLRRDYLPALGLCFQHRHGRDAAADGAGHPGGHRQADAGPRRGEARL
ncbi:hypothetical protein GCM10009688_00590 [Arthrobacter gandavensis]|uniref:Sodium-dependent dicarboxylate transporter SdcS n=1 Tax=Arthrobacter gandavensis TaxID=169960 RepID=A0ABN2NUD3_9MICC